MAATDVSIRMNGGEGENSYAKNSDFQGLIQEMMMPLVEAAVAELCRTGVPGRVAVADLGCSSGPNALTFVSAAADALRRRCSQLTADDDDGCKELCVYLNDLPGNDFNTVFKAVPDSFPLDRRRDGRAGMLAFVFGAPGSFYGRLFPAATVHLACSSCALHWLSKVPEELQSRKLVNKKNICAGRRSPPEVVNAYARQFTKDFTLFLESRAEEMVPGGWLVVSLKGRSHENIAASEDCRCWDDIADVLDDMASRVRYGVIDEEKLESFHLPVYEPCLEEIQQAVEATCSFEVVSLERHEIVESSDTAAVARGMLAMHEVAMAQHFGAAAKVIDEFMPTAERFLERLASSGSFPSKLAVHVAALRKR